MTPATYDFTPILQGSDWQVSLQFFQDDEQTIPVDLTGYQIDMHVREKPAATEMLIVALSSRADGDGAGRIGITDPAQGTIQLHLTSAETQAIVWEGKPTSVPAIVTFWYDVELVVPDGRVHRVMRGKWPFDAEITRRA